MATKRKVTMIVVLSLAIASLYAFAWAGTAQLPLMADKTHSGASGTVTLSESSISIQVKGLRPNGVYTVWFVNMKPKKQEAGAGQAPYMFKTDGQGNGTYSASLAESPYGKWEMIMIVLHPDGDPMNMKNMVGALSAKIPKSSG